MTMKAALAALALTAATASAQSASAQSAFGPIDPPTALRAANAAASTGDWPKVAALVDPLMLRELSNADAAEAHRLAGLAAFFQQRSSDAEHHFFAYLLLDLDGRLDPALYPPEAVQFFEDVRSRHAAELRARRPRPRRSPWLNLLPPIGQYENGDYTKAWIVGGALGAFAITNVTTYFVLRSWCTNVSGPNGSSATCDATHNHDHAAKVLEGVNVAAGVGLVVTYLYGVYDGVASYRRRSREQAVQPFVSPTGVVGISGSF
jgi:hypothetical protein